MKPGLKITSAAKLETSAQGFSLIELLVVVAVILIIVAIAIPSFIQSRMRANEASAVQNLRTITTANVIYSTTYSIGYSQNLTNLAGTSAVVSQTSAELIDTIVASGRKGGYTYQYTVLSSDSFGNPTGYAVNADPVSQNYTGTRHFYADQSGVIRQNNSAPAGATDSPL